MNHTIACGLALLAGGASSACAQNLPIVRVDADNTQITESCIIEIAPGAVIPDADGNGVIHIAADGITVDFADSVLRGAPEGTRWDSLTGIGVRLSGHTGVTIRNAKVHGFKVGVFATRADGLVFEQADLSDNYRAHLGSTPQREDTSDWLSPHHNDDNEWMSRYGAALYVEDSQGVTIRDVRVRRTQNGILLDNVTDSRVYDNDCSFLSGWGLGMWRSSRNTITRNAFDFCVRGHVEGVYNRGQDSAGILIFEQCNENIIAQNSATHGGDGIFGFAGLDALGEQARNHAREQLQRDTGTQSVDEKITYPARILEEHTRKGCNANIIAENDLSYAPAHGLEMTFSFDNVIYRNRLVENAICGIWGGFSQDSLIYENYFDGNGGMAYGLERGGVNIEHSAGNMIIGNTFVNNRAAVHIWWDALGDFDTLPWAKANYRGVTSNVIADNTFVVNDEPRPFHHLGEDEKRLVFHFRNDGGTFKNTVITNNRYEIDESVGKKMEIAGEVEISENNAIPGFVHPSYEVLGKTEPVTLVNGVPFSARAELRGRDKIIMDEWGPWDYESPLVRLLERRGGQDVYEIFGAGNDLTAETDQDGCSVSIVNGELPGSKRLTITAGEGVVPYAVHVTGDRIDQTLTGTLIKARWLGRVFSWKDQIDPREDFESWSRLPRLAGSRPFSCESLDFKFGWGGPQDLVRSGEMEDTSGKLVETEIGSDYFGLEAIGRLRMPRGTWRVKTVSDDGIRVYVMTGSGGNELIIDNWTWHGPTPNEGTFTVTKENDLVVMRVFYFEIDGYSTLTLDLERVGE
ncbi:MAG: hypothetical protein D6695_10005 [Planctomycetota bacterium]|nr:MAG: hypothetical protein D6695_10005 [Planctomycetota bacterium]